MKTPDRPHQQACAAWSNRILILSLLGIASLTLFPFRFRFAASPIPHRSPFLLGTPPKPVDSTDFFLNVLLFVPFGFALSARAHARGSSRRSSFLLALAAGASLSYTVELLQLYIPARDSGWEDVISNTTGSVAGFILFALCGGPVLEWMSNREELLEDWLTPRRVVLLLAAYFAFCFGISAILQHETSLSEWDPQSILVVGNDASGENPWKGQVFLLQIWNRALPEQAMQRLSGRGPVEDVSAGLLASYDFTSPTPYQDQRNFLPALGWAPEQPRVANVRATELDARSWLRTKSPVENLTREIKKSNQFTVHLVCTPAETEDVYGRIVSLSQSSNSVNFHLWQQASNFVFWFRNPLTETRSYLAWVVPGAFEAGKIRDIVAAYDGADAFLYVDGNREPRTYRLGPGAGLMHIFSQLKIPYLQGYIIFYEGLIFFPAGLLIGVEAGKWTGQKISGLWMLALGWAFPSVLLELLLAAMSGRRIWAMNIAVSLVFGVAGILLINVGGRLKNSPRGF
jgi:VanZ family protein